MEIFKKTLMYLVLGVSINGGPKACSLLNLPQAPSFHHEYSSMSCTIEIVDDVHAAIDHIHKHGRYICIHCIVFEFGYFILLHNYMFIDTYLFCIVVRILIAL